MILTVIALYFAAVIAIGAVSHRLLARTGEDYFLADRSIGPFVLLMSLFGTHMTAFALLGASAEGYREGISVFALMASSSALVVPAVFLFLGTRLWAIGKREKFITQVQFFRARWESDAFGLLMFVLLVALVVPYLLIGVMGGGITLAEVTGGQIPRAIGSLVICAVVLLYVTFGGLRGTAWVNTFQTIVFMSLGAVTFYQITTSLGGLQAAMAAVQSAHPELLVRGSHLEPARLLTYTLIPLSAGMFPHIFMHWLSAKRAEAFRVTIVAYPICIAIVWVPSVLVGVLGRLTFPDLQGPEAGSILIRMIGAHAPEALAGLLAAGVFAAVMSSLDSQVLAVGTMFTQDIVRHYGFHDRMTERGQVAVGRGFVVALLVTAYALSLVVDRGIFKLGIWCFSGFAGLVPILVAALYWRRSTKVGAFAAAATVILLLPYYVSRAWTEPGYTVAGSGVMPVAVIVLASTVAMIVGSLVSRPPAAEVVSRFFPDRPGRG